MNKTLFQNGFLLNDPIKENSISTNLKLPNYIFNVMDEKNGNYGWLDENQSVPPFVALGGFIKLFILFVVCLGNRVFVCMLVSCVLCLGYRECVFVVCWLRLSVFAEWYALCGVFCAWVTVNVCICLCRVFCAWVTVNVCLCYAVALWLFFLGLFSFVFFEQ